MKINRVHSDILEEKRELMDELFSAYLTGFGSREELQRAVEDYEAAEDSVIAATKKLSAATDDAVDFVLEVIIDRVLLRDLVKFVLLNDSEAAAKALKDLFADAISAYVEKDIS